MLPRVLFHLCLPGDVYYLTAPSKRIAPEPRIETLPLRALGRCDQRQPVLAGRRSMSVVHHNLEWYVSAIVACLQPTS